MEKSIKQKSSSEENNDILNKKKYLESLVKNFFHRIIKGQHEVDSAYAGYMYLIDKMDPSKKQEADERRRILKELYTVISRPEVIEAIQRRKMNQRQLMDGCTKLFWGTYISKRESDMRELLNEDLIANDGNGKKAVRSIDRSGQEHSYIDSKGRRITLSEIGRLYFAEWNRSQNVISKYRIIKQVEGNQYHVQEVFTNINISRMDDLEYRSAVLEELLSEDNIQLSNAEGYIGEIKEVKKEDEGLEIGEGRKTSQDYTYRINDKYNLEYDNATLSAVMINKKVECEKLNIRSKRGNNKRGRSKEGEAR